MKGTSFGVHHGGPRYVQELMGIAKSKWDDIPCIAMRQKDHEAFHSILNKYIPENPSSQQRGDLLDHLSSLNEEQKRGYYLRAMEKAYDEFKGQINDDSRDHYLNFMDQVSDKLTDQINIDLTIGVDDVIPFE